MENDRDSAKPKKNPNPTFKEYLAANPNVTRSLGEKLPTTPPPTQVINNYYITSPKTANWKVNLLASIILVVISALISPSALIWVVSILVLSWLLIGGYKLATRKPKDKRN